MTIQGKIKKLSLLTGLAALMALPDLALAQRGGFGGGFGGGGGCAALLRTRAHCERRGDGRL